MNDATQPDYPQDELRLVNCTLMNNSTAGNAGHGAGYKEMSRSGDSEAFGQIGNANRYFYNCLMENNYCLESNEVSDFTTPELYGHSMENNYIGRYVVLGGASVEEFLSVVNDGNGVTEATVHGYSGEQLGDNFFHVASDPVAPGIYDMSGFMVPGVALPDESALKTGGDVKWLVLADRELPIPNNTAKSVIRSGYDISKTDALGFERPQGTCAVGASEYSVSEITPYLDGSLELPYISSSTSAVKDVIAGGSAPIITRQGNVVSAAGSALSVYSLSGQKVAAANGSVDMASLAAGIYLVEARSAQGSTVIKVIK